jgi:hypothetical protein
MNLRARLINHHKRWNIEFDDEEQFTQLKNRVVSIVDRTLGQNFAEDPKIDREFAEILGISVKLPKSIPMFQGMGINKRKFGATYLYSALEKSGNPERLVTVLQVLFWLLEQYGRSQKIQELADSLRVSVRLTPRVEFQIVRRGDKVTLYPPGARLLDEATVNEPLIWLENYPTAAEPFERALKIYLDGDTSRNRNLLDNLRFAVEQILREVLSNKTRLEEQKTQLLSWVRRDDRVDKNIANMYATLLKHYGNYQNEAVKHSENWSEPEIEFMIYLTGTFMRLLIQLSESNVDTVDS